MSPPAPAALSYPFATIPESGGVVRVAEGIVWASLPIPFTGLRQVNIWFLRDGPGWTMIDCGHGDEATRARLLELFESALEGRPVTRLVLTHFHPDHVGNSGFVCAHWGGLLPVMAQAEWFAANLAVRSAYTDAFGDRASFHALHGLAPERAAQFDSGSARYAKGVQLPPAFQRIAEGQSLRIDGDEWVAIRGGGHSPEHISLWCRARAILIAGDQILPTISTNISVWPTEPLADPLGLFLDSCRHFHDIIPPETLILPSHRRPFFGIQARARELLAHHGERLSVVLAACAEPRAAGELLDVMFTRALDGHQLGFAMGEALAHLNHLVCIGHLERLPVEHGVQRFRRRPGAPDQIDPSR